MLFCSLVPSCRRSCSAKAGPQGAELRRFERRGPVPQVQPPSLSAAYRSHWSGRTCSKVTNSRSASGHGDPRDTGPLTRTTLSAVRWSRKSFTADQTVDAPHGTGKMITRRQRSGRLSLSNLVIVRIGLSSVYACGLGQSCPPRTSNSTVHCSGDSRGNRSSIRAAAASAYASGAAASGSYMAPLIQKSGVSSMPLPWKNIQLGSPAPTLGWPSGIGRLAALHCKCTCSISSAAATSWSRACKKRAHSASLTDARTDVIAGAHGAGQLRSPRQSTRLFSAVLRRRPG
mmetsp:Transcript_67954/g.180796  ORF Transcript_67954/g.180796 Transcript_67954/m.180796 type:complete len:287 (-) Transcript_67954:11-871(-)